MLPSWSPEQVSALWDLVLALLLGALMGIEREFSMLRHQGRTIASLWPAGLRTFMLLSLMGALAVLLNRSLPGSYGIVLGAVALLTAAGYVMASRRGQEADADVGATTEAAMLAAFLIGSLVGLGLRGVAVSAAVLVTAVLAIKRPAQHIAGSLEEVDLIAGLRFAVVALVVLPVLPDRSYGPFGVLNPQQIGLMAVLIAGIGFAGYVLVRTIGPERGLGLSGLLGGLVSSTAVTLAFTHRSREQPELAHALALGIGLACSILFVRLLVVIGVVYAPLLRAMAPALLSLFAVGMLVGLGPVLRARRRARQEAQAATPLTVRNPARLWPAFQFALLYAAVLVLTKAAQTYYGDQGLLLASVLSGIADLDAITLSVTNLFRTGSISAETARTAIIIAAVTNTLAKLALVLALGSVSLKRQTAPILGAIAALGLLLSWAF
ncbi:MAG: MgtC/SapB family protein [Bacteroidetes bacterium]|nr:MgtC/SapB family protein [Rhodothermia bacterium]MCS7154213.1 MgtC/SapB family protein [Bacteroidota bacterium]MCX7906751.1 MgtC/SapB family protein [Bacteroidota bacterium]MDW8136969.1 MgtC/SapB family protein [Bacteroidota bacterium]MDW8285160.1 MgtC/SapB family protein [Bacteroidota bacterium]